jgi:hypothetical protein
LQDRGKYVGVEVLVRATEGLELLAKCIQHLVGIALAMDSLITDEVLRTG